MSLTTAISEYPAEWTHQEILDAIRSRTVNVVGILPGAELQGLMIASGLMPLIYDTRGDTAYPDPVFRGICIGMMSRFDPDGEIDFSVADNVALLDYFIANMGAAAETIVASTAFGSKEGLNAAVIAKATSPVTEFPETLMKDIVAIRDPALSGTAYSNELTVTGEIGNNQRLKVNFSDDFPEAIAPIVEIQHTLGGTDTAWKGSGVAGFSGVKDAADYRITIPGEVISDNCKIRLKVPYNINVTITKV